MEEKLTTVKTRKQQELIEIGKAVIKKQIYIKVLEQIIIPIELQVPTLRDSMKTECRRCYLSCARWELASSLAEPAWLRDFPRKETECGLL